MDKIDIEQAFYHPICNNEEIERIINVQNGNDYLLKLRADTIVDHMRLFRVYRNKALADEKHWSLEKSFVASHYRSFLYYLPEEIKAKCSELTCGNIFSNDPCGKIFNTKYGPIVTISESLLFFLQFSHLALFEFKSEIPHNIRINALRIAMRVMLKTEALDFFMDPRGIIPQDIAQSIQAPLPNQLEYIAGHEYAHFILGHLSDVNTINEPLFYAISPRDSDYKLTKVYNSEQKDEFEADIQAILLPQYNPKKKKEILEAALCWFGCLELFETVRNALYPSSPWGYRSHPTARERFYHILTGIPSSSDMESTNWQRFLDIIDKFNEFLLDDVSNNIELYEMYGSVYLDKPDTDWRGPKLVDRVDYY